MGRSLPVSLFGVPPGHQCGTRIDLDTYRTIKVQMFQDLKILPFSYPKMAPCNLSGLLSIFIFYVALYKVILIILVCVSLPRSRF